MTITKNDKSFVEAFGLLKDYRRNYKINDEQEFRKALNLMLSCLKKIHFHKSWEQYFVRGGFNYATKRGNEAINILDFPILQDIDSAPVELIIGGLLAESGNLSVTIDYFDALLQETYLEKDESDYIKLSLAELNRLSSNYDSARIRYMEIDGLDGYIRSQKLKGLASTYKVQNQYKNAIECLNELIKDFPGNFRFYFSRGHLYHHSAENKKKFKFASLDYKESVSLREKEGKQGWHVAHFHLGLVSGHLGEIDDMNHHLSLASKCFFEDRSWHNDINLALAYIIQNRVIEGINLARNSLAFLGPHEVNCSLKNATTILSDQKLRKHLHNTLHGIQEYEAYCRDRLEDIENVRIEHKKIESLASSSRLFRPVQACIGTVRLTEFSSWTMSNQQTNITAIGELMQKFFALCIARLRSCTSSIRLTSDGVSFVSRVWAVSHNALKNQMEQLFTALLDLQEDFDNEFQSYKPLRLIFAVAFGDVLEINFGENRQHIGQIQILVDSLIPYVNNSAGIVCVDKKLLGELRCLDVVDELIKAQYNGTPISVSISGYTQDVHSLIMPNNRAYLLEKT